MLVVMVENKSVVGGREENLETQERKNSWEPRIQRATGTKREETR